MSIELRPYQEKFIGDIRHEFAHGCRTVCGVMPCGAGKTVATGWMAGETARRGKRVVFMVHRRELIEQTSKTFSAMGIPHGLIASGVEPVYELPVQIASVQTLARRLGDNICPNLIICDECHHATASTYRSIMDNWPEAFVVGVTATPQRTDGKGLGDIFKSMVIGPTAMELIEWGNLAPEMTYSLPTGSKINRSSFRKSHGDYVAADVEKAMMDANVFGDIVEHYRRLTPGSQAICYCITREYSRILTERFEAAGIPAAHVDCKTGRKDREKAIEGFRRGDIRVLCNVDLFGEGFDVPAVGVVILARPTASLILHIQQTMRAMRADPKEPGKRAIILDHVGNVKLHGLPEMDREWSLDDRKAKSSKPPALKECPQCYRTVSAAVRKCPECGYEWPQADDEAEPARQAREDTSVDLELYGESEMLRKNHEAFLRKMRVPELLKKAKTMQDLYNIAAYAGYKPGWAYYRAKAMGIRS